MRGSGRSTFRKDLFQVCQEKDDLEADPVQNSKARTPKRNFKPLRVWPLPPKPITPSSRGCRNVNKAASDPKTSGSGGH